MIEAFHDAVRLRVLSEPPSEPDLCVDPCMARLPG
jgi:hypothetical protein